MNRYFAGIDGGQSSTVAVVGDERGRILATGRAGPADEIGATKDSTRLRDALHGALADACANAHLPADARFEAIVAGISGYDGRIHGRAPELASECVALLHDTPIAHAGAFSGGSGVIVIAGTGSVVYGRNEDGWSCTLGGWGYLFGDEGSAFGIAREALALLMRAQDEADATLATESRAACDFFGLPSLRRIVHALYKGEMTRDRVAAFAPEAMRFESLRSIAYRGAERLAVLTRAAVAAGAAPRVAFIGGVFDDPGFRERVTAGVLQKIPAAEIVPARYEPAYGALLLAYGERSLRVRELAR
ncbi:MAG TPA: BadF/BadG/BcrA/BcrD ATPase family protein [Candidatus Nitrosotalea sp.]|nr:BadF/BadG/BcrA/BcrD ATPase family protein [Candidatus Nitrosotalea sp.]